jgi:ABC-2 type transport system permease protein
MTLFRREFASYFNSPVAFIVVPIFLLVFGIFFFFVPDYFMVNQASLRRLFDMAPLVLAIFAPALTMRLLAEERRSGSIELLVTMPLKEEEIILGKFLGAFALMATALLMTLSYAVTTAALGELDWGPVLGGYLGAMLLSGAYLSIGTLTSSLTNNQIVAFFVALFVSICLFLVDAAAALYLPGSLVPLAEFLSFNQHFQNIARGVIDLRDVVFYLSVIAICLFTAVHALRVRRLS